MTHKPTRQVAAQTMPMLEVDPYDAEVEDEVDIDFRPRGHATTVFAAPYSKAVPPQVVASSKVRQQTLPAPQSPRQTTSIGTQSATMGPPRPVSETTSARACPTPGSEDEFYSIHSSLQHLPQTVTNGGRRTPRTPTIAFHEEENDVLPPTALVGNDASPQTLRRASTLSLAAAV